MTISNEPSFVVDAGGILVSAIGVGAKDKVTFYSSDPKLVAEAIRAADLNLEVEFIQGARLLVAGWGNEEGILAALLSAVPGRSYIREAPKEILETIHSLAGPQGDGTIY